LDLGQQQRDAIDYLREENQEAPGIDGVTFAAVEAQLPCAFQAHLLQQHLSHIGILGRRFHLRGE
jgi:hypothetical protein